MRNQASVILNKFCEIGGQGFTSAQNPGIILTVEIIFYVAFLKGANVSVCFPTISINCVLWGLT